MGRVCTLLLPPTYGKVCPMYRPPWFSVFLRPQSDRNFTFLAPKPSLKNTRKVLLEPPFLSPEDIPNY